jgi:hypothetical protein
MKKVLAALGVLAVATFLAIAPNGMRSQIVLAQSYQLCDGAEISSFQLCPSDPYGYNSVGAGYTICPNGQIAYSSQTCYSTNYASTYTTCPNGQVVYPPQTCPVTVYPNSYPYCNSPYGTGSQNCCPNGYGGYQGYANQYCPPNTAVVAPSVTYAPGWNIVSGPAGTTLVGSTSPLYAFLAGTTAYQIYPAGTTFQPGVGYWAYFPNGGSANFGSGAVFSTTVSLPPGQFVMIGNPGTGTAVVSGANAVVLTYNPASGTYTPTTQLAPGQGGWAASQTGGILTITSSGGPPPPPPPL